MIYIGDKRVGLGEPAFIIAELSGNHGGDINHAKELIRKAAEMGVDAVKLQTYRPDTITLDSDNPDFRIPAENPWADSGTLFDLYRSTFTPWDWHQELFDLARDLGLVIFSSPFDPTALELLEELDAPAYKIASPEITDIPLIRSAARTGKPIIVSTGVAQEADIRLAVDTIRQEGNDQIVLLKCTSSYPAPMDSLNLATIPDMFERFGCLAGLSDHSHGLVAPVVAVTLGAVMVEKHFVLSKSDASEDAFFSLDATEFTAMVQAVRSAEAAVGHASYEIDAEMAKNRWGRRSLYISADIEPGDLFTEENIRSVRPGFGLHPKHYEEILGRKATRKAKRGDRLTWDLVEVRETN